MPPSSPNLDVVKKLYKSRGQKLSVRPAYTKRSGILKYYLSTNKGVSDAADTPTWIDQKTHKLWNRSNHSFKSLKPEKHDAPIEDLKISNKGWKGFQQLKKHSISKGFQSTYWDPENPKATTEYKAAPCNLPFKIRQVPPTSKPLLAFLAAKAFEAATSPDSSKASQDSIASSKALNASEKATLSIGPPPRLRNPTCKPPQTTSLYLSLLFNEGWDSNPVDVARKQWGHNKGRPVGPWNQQRIFRYLPHLNHEAYTKALANFAATQGPFHIKLRPFVQHIRSKWHIRFDLSGQELERPFGKLSGTLRGESEMSDIKKSDPSMRPFGQWTVLAKDNAATEEEANALVDTWMEQHAEDRNASVMVNGLKMGLEKRMGLEGKIEERAALEKEDMELWPRSKMFLFTGKVVEDEEAGLDAARHM